MPCVTPRNTFIFTAMSGPSPNLGGSLLNTLAPTIHLGAVSIRNTENAPNRGDKNPLENWSDNNKLQNTLLMSSLLPTARSTARAYTFLPYALLASQLRYTSNWPSIYNAFTLSTISMF